MPNERVVKLKKAVDDLYANMYLWHQLDNSTQDKLALILEKMKTQKGLVLNKDKNALPFKKGTEDF